MSENIKLLKDLHQLVSTLNKIYDNTDGVTYGVLYNFIIKLTDYFFTTIYKQPLSINDFAKYSTINKKKSPQEFTAQCTFIWNIILLIRMCC